MSEYTKKCDCDRKHKNKNFDCCEKITDSKAKKILLECGQNFETARFDLDGADNQRFTLGRVIVDASCLYKPEVKIEFSSIVFFQSDQPDQTGSTIVLNFELKRSCNNGDIEPVLTRLYRKDTQINMMSVNEIISSEPFTISFCECLDCSVCCEYIVEVSGNLNNFVNIGKAEVGDLSLGAFAQGLACD